MLGLSIRVWTKMLEINTKITSFDKVVFSLIGYMLPFTFNLFPSPPFMGGSVTW